MRRIAFVVLAALAMAGLGACSETFDREGSIDTFVEQGFTQEEAECFVDGLVDEFGEDKAVEIDANFDDASEEDRNTYIEILLACKPDLAGSSSVDTVPEESPSE